VCYAAAVCGGSCLRTCFATEQRKAKKMTTTRRMAMTSADSFACWSEAGCCAVAAGAAYFSREHSAIRT
jgi:hypothetical protein